MDTAQKLYRAGDEGVLPYLSYSFQKEVTADDGSKSKVTYEIPDDYREQFEADYYDKYQDYLFDHENKWEQYAEENCGDILKAAHSNAWSYAKDQAMKAGIFDEE